MTEVNLSEILANPYIAKTRVLELCVSKDIMVSACVISTWYQCVTDKTDGQKMGDSYNNICYADTLFKTGFFTT